MLTSEERAILDEVNFQEPGMLLNRFQGLVRQSGGEDEKSAAFYIADRLKEYGIPYEILWPEIYLSVPKKAELKVIGHNIDIDAKTPSYSVSTEDKWVDGELIFASSYGPPYALDDVEYKLEFDRDPKGRIVICEGVPSPDKVNDIVDNGGVAAIFIQSGERIHEGICTTVWGTPGLDDLDSLMRIPVVSIKSSDGVMLMAMIKEGKVRVAVRTQLDEGWNKCPLVVTRITGYKEPDKFILLHGHLDSWHTGIGDNALGDASLLEISRILHKYRDKLKRSVWIAWWPGHSTGRFAGSTWFADQYAMEFYENCIAQVNCESTGCINTDSYEDIMWTEDVDDFCRELVLDVTGIVPKWARPIRAGDYSFNNIGITSFFMLSSAIGQKRSEELGYYRVYGCGGNIEWHTELDDMRLVDEKAFIRDTRLYLAGIFRMANADILPIDLRNLLYSMEKHLYEYQETAGCKFDFSPVLLEVSALKCALDSFYTGVLNYHGDELYRSMICDTILKVSRKLIRVNYTCNKVFSHDPASMLPPIPDLAPILRINQLNPDRQKFLITQMIRGRNRVIHALRECREIVGREIRNNSKTG